MKGFLLDTNYISELVRISPEPLAMAWMDQADEAHLFLSTLTLGEIRKGITGMSEGNRRDNLERWLTEELPRRFAGRILPVDAAVSDRWGRLMADAKRQGTPLPTVDALLAATALHHDLAVVTRNVSDFAAARVPVVNPWLPA